MRQCWRSPEGGCTLADVTMPQLGETVTEGTITKWLKAVGEAVARDEPLFEVSTDKVDSEVPSPAAGTLAEIRVQEGETVDVGTVLAVVSADGAGCRCSRRCPRHPPRPPLLAPAPPGAAPAAAAAGPATGAGAHATAAAGTAAPTSPGPSPCGTRTVPAAPSRLRRPPAATARASGATGSCRRWCAGCSTTTASTPPRSPAPASAAGSRGRTCSTSSTRRRAGGAPASGAVPRRLRRRLGRARNGRRAERRDRDRHAATLDAIGVARGVARRRRPRPAPTRSSPSPTSVAAPPSTWSGPRRRVPTRSWCSKRTTSRSSGCGASHGAQFRAEEGFALTYLPFVARATVEALHEWPHLNASVGDDSLIVHHQFNMGFAVDLDHKGLIVPVVKHAEELTLRGMARRIRELADRARTKKLSADDISGGTFSITNAGPFGTFLTAPIINQPQVAILSTDGVKRRPTVVVQPDGTEAIAIHSLGLLCLAWDHRAVDGAYAAAFVARVTEMLATHDWAAEL